MSCLILGVILHFECYASFWILGLILDVMLHFGCPALFWTPCIIPGTNILFEDHALFWMLRPFLGVILHSRYHVIVLYVLPLISFASLFRCRITFAVSNIPLVRSSLTIHSHSYTNTTWFGRCPLLRRLHLITTLCQIAIRRPTPNRCERRFRLGFLILSQL